MSRKFVSKKAKKLSSLKYLIILAIVCIIINFIVNKLNQKTEESIIVKYLINTYFNQINFNKFKVDLSNPEIILDTALNFNDIIKLTPVKEDKTTFQENKLYQVYIYNTHQTEEYDAGSLKNYNIDLTVFTASNILEKKLSAYNIDAYVENRSVKEHLNKYGFNYNQSYKITREFLENFPNEVDLYIDLHRDSGNKEQTTVYIDNKPYAKIMFVIGTNYETYNLNMELSAKLNSYFVEFNPTISKGIFTRHSVYNQDLNPNIILIEIGGPYNTLEEVENTLDVFAEVINKYLKDKYGRE